MVLVRRLQRFSLKFYVIKTFSLFSEDAVETITMPGAVAALENLNKKFSTMDLSELVHPAIEYATNGIIISPRVAFDWQHSYKNLKGIAKNYYLNQGKPYKVGSIFKSPGQAKVLQKIGREGSKGFFILEKLLKILLIPFQKLEVYIIMRIFNQFQLIMLSH